MRKILSYKGRSCWKGFDINVNFKNIRINIILPKYIYHKFKIFGNKRFLQKFLVLKSYCGLRFGQFYYTKQLGYIIHTRYNKFLKKKNLKTKKKSLNFLKSLQKKKRKNKRFYRYKQNYKIKSNLFLKQYFGYDIKLKLNSKKKKNYLKKKLPYKNKKKYKKKYN